MSAERDSTSSSSDDAPNPFLSLAALVVGWRRAATATMQQPLGSDARPPPPISDDAQGGSTLHANHPFFSYYASLVHQQNMLQDSERTAAYHTAITANASDFKDKVVVDVGTGSGILAIFAARAGARHVYALEASGVASHARALVAANGLSSVITVLQCKAEEAELPEAADVLVSEPMGFMLVHERMLETYLAARARLLKPGGLCFPCRGLIHFAPFTDSTLHAEQVAKAAFWGTTDFYGVDLSCLVPAAACDHFAQPVVGYVDPASLLAPIAAHAHHVIDFSTDTPQSLHTFTVPFAFTASKTGVCHGIASWFDVEFPGTTQRVTLSTGPHSPGTHWYQSRILLREPIAVNVGQVMSGDVVFKANARYSYDLQLRVALPGSEATTGDGSRITSVSDCSLADQMYAGWGGGGAGAPGAASGGAL